MDYYQEVYNVYQATGIAEPDRAATATIAAWVKIQHLLGAPSSPHSMAIDLAQMVGKGCVSVNELLMQQAMKVKFSRTVRITQ